MIEHAFAETNGVRLHYAAEGKGELILFAHGFPEFWYAWKNQLDEFGRTHLAVAPDLRGYNLSSKPPESKTTRHRCWSKTCAASRSILGTRSSRWLRTTGEEWSRGRSPSCIRKCSNGW